MNDPIYDAYEVRLGYLHLSNALSEDFQAVCDMIAESDEQQEDFFELLQWLSKLKEDRLKPHKQRAEFEEMMDHPIVPCVQSNGLRLYVGRNYRPLLCFEWQQWGRKRSIKNIPQPEASPIAVSHADERSDDDQPSTAVVLCVDGTRWRYEWKSALSDGDDCGRELEEDGHCPHCAENYPGSIGGLYVTLKPETDPFKLSDFTFFYD